MRAEAVEALQRAAKTAEPILDRAGSLRYAGQNYELEVALPPGDLDEGNWDELLRRFEAEHERQYGFALPGETVELVNLRVTALGPEQPPAFALSPRVAGGPGRYGRCGSTRPVRSRVPSSGARRSLRAPSSTARS